MGGFAAVLCIQGVKHTIDLFFGPVVSRSCMKCRSCNLFSTNFQTAINPR